MIIQAVIFDLDGIIVDTARYHFLAWKRLAAELGFDFSERDNEKLKGISRMESLNILLATGNISLEQTLKKKLAEKKNLWYKELIEELTPNDILPGISHLIAQLKDKNILLAVGSASKNTPSILNKLQIANEFNAVVDGSMIENAKPNPEIFLKCAEKLNVSPQNCIVIEDAHAGIEAANRAGMFSLGIGDNENLSHAKVVLQSLQGITAEKLLNFAK